MSIEEELTKVDRALDAIIDNAIESAIPPDVFRAWTVHAVYMAKEHVRKIFEILEDEYYAKLDQR